MKIKYNDCSKCKYFYQEYDYFGDCNEECELKLKLYECKHCKSILIIKSSVKKIVDNCYEIISDIRYKIRMKRNGFKF